MNTDVLTRLHELCRREHACTVDVIEALVECERTGAHLDRGHDGLWSLLVRELGYSNAAASRRLKATRCARKFPEVIAWLRARRVTLSSLEAVEPVLASIASSQELLDRIEGKAPVEVARAVQQERPVAPKKETVRRRFVKPEPASAGGLFEAVAAPACEPVVENVQASLSFTPEEFAVVEMARAILSRKTGRMKSVHETMMELARFYVAAKGPRPPRGRGSNVQAKVTSDRKYPPHVASDRKSPAQHPARRTRCIPPAVRDAVMRRDGERCTFTGPDGRRCGSTKNLQIDHVHPFALGGAHEVGNLRVLRGVHNRHRARRTFGLRSRPLESESPNPSLNSAARSTSGATSFTRNRTSREGAAASESSANVRGVSRIDGNVP